MASLGAKVLQVRSVELAMVHKVRTFVRSSFDDPTPQIATARHAHLRRGGDRGTAGRHRHRLFQGRGPDHAPRAWPTSPASPPAIFGPLAEANINVDMIVQVVSDDATTTDITFTVPTADYERARTILEDATRQHRLSQRSRARPTSSRCRSSASACAAMPASRPSAFKALAGRASTSGPSRRRRSRSRC